MQHKYTTWREKDGEIMPVVEKPDIKKYGSNYVSDLDYAHKIHAYNESLKIKYPIIGDISKVRGREDLVEGKDFFLWRQWFREKSNEWLNVNEDLLLNPNCKTRYVAVLIDNQQKVDVPIAGRADEKAKLQDCLHTILNSSYETLEGGLMKTVIPKQAIVNAFSEYFDVEEKIPF